MSLTQVLESIKSREAQQKMLVRLLHCMLSIILPPSHSWWLRPIRGFGLTFPVSPLLNLWPIVKSISLPIWLQFSLWNHPTLRLCLIVVFWILRSLPAAQSCQDCIVSKHWGFYVWGSRCLLECDPFPAGNIFFSFEETQAFRSWT